MNRSINSTQTATWVKVTQKSWFQWIMIGLLVYLLICAVSIIGDGFKTAVGDKAADLFAFANNPIAGLLVGIMATALVQSSSTVTSIIVGLVAGGLPVSMAVPMVMGANVGTSITNTIVSLGHVREPKEFSRAFSAATVHDFFNLYSVLIFLPLEMAFGLFEKLGKILAEPFINTGDASMKGFNFVKMATEPVVDVFVGMATSFGTLTGGITLIVIGIAMIILTITFLGRLLRELMVGKAKEMIENAIGKGPLRGIFSGTLVTILVQSSSTTTSLMVPLAGAGTFGLRQIYPFSLGANIGTCITALLAATAVSGNVEAALQIAFIHLTYNLIGVAVIYGLAPLRNLPVKAALGMGSLAAKNRLNALLYILVVFFLFPAFSLAISETMFTS